VHCPQSDIWVSSDEEEDVDEEMEQTQFDMDDVSAQGEMDASKNETETTIPEGPRLSEIAVALDRLIPSSILQARQERLRGPGVPGGLAIYGGRDINHQNATSLLLQLLQVFGRIVLPTHSSHHVQYCLFYMASLKKSFADAFLDYLWKQFVNPNTGSMIRQSSASYMASFLSRANFISLGIITASLELMAKWVHSYIDNQELSSQVKQDVNIHRPFYTLCQLNPLSYCLPSIVNIFATITRKYQVVFCYTIIERNARVCNVAQYQSSGFKKLIDLNNPLDTFFPFDPYLLPKSGEFIDSLYKQWEGTDLQQKSQSTQPEDEEDEFRIYEAHLQEVPLGLMPSSLSAVSPGFMSP
ncbi:putative RNA polymerase I-specific transcription initiation factor RRN3, partial [Apostichopus japonicus]